MNERISSLNPNLYLVGLYIQENALKGYKLVEGYPMLFGYQYETLMELPEATPQASEVAHSVEQAAPKKQGRPAKA